MFVAVAFPTKLIGAIITDNAVTTAIENDELTWVEEKLNTIGLSWKYYHYWPGDFYYIDIVATEQELRDKVQALVDAGASDISIDILSSSTDNSSEAIEYMPLIRLTQ